MFPKQYMSVRFFPWWSELESDQIIGLINMINSILQKKGIINSLVEIGSHLGESSTIFLGFNQIKKMYCIDPWNQHPVFEEIFNQRLQKLLFQKRCQKIKALSCEASKTFLDNSIDMVYVDGNHDYEYVSEDIKLWYPKIVSGGILAGHDYADDHPGTKKAIDEFMDKYNFKIQTFIDSSWYIIKE